MFGITKKVYTFEGYINLNIKKNMNVEKLNEAFESFKEDYAKFEKGNKSAGTRARKSLQDIRQLSFDIRKEITAAKNS